MSKYLNIFKNGNNHQPTQNQDQNQLKNQNNTKNIKPKAVLKPSKSLQSTIIVQSNPLTTYRTVITDEQSCDKKFQLLAKFHHLASKSHYIHNLKFQTLFLAVSLAQKTAELVLNNELSYEYWVVGCLFMSMKYEEIYPPRLKDLSILIKQKIRSQDYNKAQLKILDFIDLDLNFVTLNTYLSEYLHVTSEFQRYFIFYFLQIALSLRFHLKKFSLKELVLSVMFIFSSNRLHFYSNQLIDGVPFERIEECSKFIILSHDLLGDRHPLLHKKYKSQTMKCVALNSIPKMESLSALLVKKADKEASIPKIVGLCKDQKFDGETTDDDDDEGDLMMRILEERAKKRMDE